MFINSKYIEIIKWFKLESYFNHILNHNKANNAPYHNIYHTLNVMQYAYEIMRDTDCTARKTELVLKAALFHDFNHSMGKLSDGENVELAIEEFLKVSEEDEEDNEIIVSLIRATQYPYVTQALTYEQKVIRDADLCQIFNDNYIQQCVFGLSQEFNIPVKTFIQNQIQFILSISFYTDYAKNMYNENINRLVSDLVFLSELQ